MCVAKDEQLEQLHAGINTLENEIVQGRNQMGEVLAAVELKDAEIISLKEIRESTQSKEQSEISELKAQTELLESQHSEKQQEMKELEHSKQELEGQVLLLATSLEESKACIDGLTAAHAQAQTLEGAAIEKEAENAQLRAEIEMKDSDIASLREIQESLQVEEQSELKTLTARNGELVIALEAKMGMVEQLTKEIETLESMHAEKGQEIDTLVTSNSTLQQQVLTFETSLEELHAKLNEASTSADERCRLVEESASAAAATREDEINQLRAEIATLEGDVVSLTETQESRQTEAGQQCRELEEAVLAPLGPWALRVLIIQ